MEASGEKMPAGALELLLLVLLDYLGSLSLSVLLVLMMPFADDPALFTGSVLYCIFCIILTRAATVFALSYV